MQDVAKQDLVQNTALMDSRMKLETWRIGIKQRALEHKLTDEQASYSPCRKPYPYPHPDPNLFFEFSGNQLFIVDLFYWPLIV